MTMNRTQVDEVFRRRYRGNPNILTPDVVDRFAAHGLLWEISVGKFMETWLAGVTALTYSGATPPGDVSQCCNGMTREGAIQAARDYIASYRVSP